MRIRTLYQHAARYSPERLAYIDQFADGKAEYRTIDELVERLIICDETVAFIPVRDDRQVALEIRHPGLVRYLIKVFEFIWGRAVPLTASTPYETAPDGITDIQHSIAKFPRQRPRRRGRSPARLGMNVRTCRAHFAELATALGSGGLAQLGFLIAQSGILDQEARRHRRGRPSTQPRRARAHRNTVPRGSALEPVHPRPDVKAASRRRGRRRSAVPDRPRAAAARRAANPDSPKPRRPGPRPPPACCDEPTERVAQGATAGSPAGRRRSHR
ncbi:hypothetical protein SCYAM73S_07846 [Streptomyces cyaneofuscatus]